MKNAVHSHYSTRCRVVLVLLCVMWFVHVSPKTPLEFFDTATRDSDAIQRRTMEKYEMINAVASAEIRKFDMLPSLGQQMQRIALVHDLTNHPTQVQKQKFSIISGSYDCDKRTVEYLKANSEEYRALAKNLAECRTKIKEMKANRELSSRLKYLQSIVDRDKLFHMAIFRMVMDRAMLRRFQAVIFWWRG